MRFQVEVVALALPFQLGKAWRDIAATFAKRGEQTAIKRDVAAHARQRVARGNAGQGTFERGDAVTPGGFFVAGCAWRRRCRRSWCGPDPARQGVGELARVDRLGDVVVHAGGGAGAAILRHGGGGHGDDRHGPPGRQEADTPCRFEAVHHRHVQIHQHGVEFAVLHRVQRLLAVAGQRYGEAALAEEFLRHLLIQLVVFDEQDARAADTLECRARFG